MDAAHIERILRAAVTAPSGDNSQPWSFTVSAKDIVIRAHPDKDHAILNVAGRGTLLATGAAIENIVIAAKHEGFETIVEPFDEALWSMRMTFTPTTPGHNRVQAVFDRHTNRHPYQRALAAGDYEALAGIHAEPHCRIVLVNEPQMIRRIATASTLMEETALRTKKIHRLFFDSIIWRHEDNEQGASGLFIKTTELPPPVQGLFKLIRHWSVMRLFHAIGFPKLAAKANASVFSQSGACIAVSLDRKEAQDFVSAGRCMQRIWIEATHRGLAAQPLAGLLYLAEYIARTEDADIDASLRRRVQAAREEIAGIFNVPADTLAIILRVGTPKKAASARAKRRAPLIS